MVCLVYLVCFVCLVDLVHLVSFVQPNKRDKLNKQNNGLLMLAEILLEFPQPRSFDRGASVSSSFPSGPRLGGSPLLARIIHDGSSSPSLTLPHTMGEGEGGGPRQARGAMRPRCVLVQYGEGTRGEPAGRRPVVAADRRLQQNCS